MANISNFNDTWEGHTHGEVEDVIKSKVAEMETETGKKYEKPDGGIPLEDLSDSVQDAIEDAASQGGIQQESDPTVPIHVKNITQEQIASWNNKVNPDGNKVLSDNNYTTEEKTKLAGIEAGAQVNVAPDAEMSGTSEKAVQNKVIKAYVDQAVQTVQNALNALMSGQSVTDAIDTFNDIVTFLNGIDTDDPTLFNQLKSLSDAITALNTALAGKVNTSTTVNGKPLSGNVTIGMSDIQGLLEALANAGGESVVINSDGANIVDSHTNPSILVAPSARQMYMAYQNINKLFTKVNDLYDKLAGIAFKDGKPDNWKENADWLTPAIPTHTITLGTMSNVSASMNGTAISGSVTATEGEVTIKLTPSQGAMVLTENITIKLGAENVPFTTAADNGSTLVTFILAGDVTFSASASSGRAISFTGTGCTIDDAGVPIGEDLDTTIRANEHFTLPASITVKIGNANVTHTYTKAQDGKTAALHIDAANITGDLTITCTAVEDAHVMLSVSGSGYTISDGTKTYSNGDKVYNTVQVTLSIAPASGKKFTTLPTADKGTMTNNGAYAASSLLIGTSVSGTIVISAVTADLTNYSVGIQSIANFSVAYTDLSGNAIAAENNVATVAENSGVKIRLTPTSNDYAITVGSMTMGGSSVTPSVTTDNGVTVITIEHVTGAVVVSAEANEAGAVEITTTAEKATVTDNGAKQGGTLVLTVAPISGYGFKAAEDANDVNRGVILVKDGNNNTIVDTVNGIGLDKVTYGTLTKGSVSGTGWSRFPSFASTIITIDNAPAAVSVNVTPALIFQENAFRNSAGTNIFRPYPYYMANLIVKVNGLPCVHYAKIDNVGGITSTSKGYWGRVTTSTVVGGHEPSLICYNGDTVTGSWKTWDPQTLTLSGKVIDKWIIPSGSKKDSNGITYLEKSYLYHYPGGDTSDASDRKVIFDGSNKSMWILVFDDLTPKVVFKGIPSGVVPKRWSDSGSESRDCVEIDGYYTEWGDTSVKITMTGVSNVTCNDSNVSITESSGTFTIVVSNLTSGEVRNVNLNVTV